ncbi:MAG: hypothetical protein ABIE55_02025 [Candidatus Aenigmatarchaeota archaeon]
MSKNFWFDISLSILIILILVLSVPAAITGFAFSQIDLSIQSSTEVEILLFDYDPFIVLNPFEMQNISIEILNSGTEAYTAKIEAYVYFYEDSILKEVAHYYDSDVYLTPGLGRYFSSTYAAYKQGFYYIKLKISYGTKRAEAWGSFYAGYITYNTTPGPPGPYVPGGGGGGGGWTPPAVYFVDAQPLGMDVNYSEKIYLYPGQSTLTNIKVKNIGNQTLHELKFHFSASNILDIDVNPKQDYYLDINETVIFLMDIDTDSDIPIGTYPIDFEIITREVKGSYKINLNVIPYNITLEEEVRRRILNYEYLITELEIDILEAYMKDIDTTMAVESIDFAKINIGSAKNYFELGDYEKAMGKLDEVKENLKESVFLLAQASFMIFVPQAFSPFWILIIAVLLGLLFLFLLSRRKKTVKRPKLLRATEETET